MERNNKQGNYFLESIADFQNIETAKKTGQPII